MSTDMAATAYEVDALNSKRIMVVNEKETRPKC